MAHDGTGRVAAGPEVRIVLPGGARESNPKCTPAMPVVARGCLGLGCTLIGSWLGVDRFKHAKDGRCTACTAAYRFGGGWALVARWKTGAAATPAAP